MTWSRRLTEDIAKKELLQEADPAPENTEEIETAQPLAKSRPKMADSAKVAFADDGEAEDQRVIRTGAKRVGDDIAGLSGALGSKGYNGHIDADMVVDVEGPPAVRGDPTDDAEQDTAMQRFRHLPMAW